MDAAEIQRLAENWFNPHLNDQRSGFQGAVQRVLGEASSRGMAYSGATYGAVENLAQKEVEHRGRTMLEGYEQALSASAGTIPQNVKETIKQGLDKALLSEAEQIHAAIQYVRDAIKPDRTMSAADMRVRPMQKITADFDLFCAQLTTERGVPTFGWKPTSIEMHTFAPFEHGQFSTAKEVNQLVGLMFSKPETEIQYYHQDGTAIDAALQQAIDAGDILLAKTEFRFFRHPQHPKNFILIEEGSYKSDWEKQTADFTPEFVKETLRLSARKRTELETILKIELEEQVREERKRQKFSYDVFLSYSDKDKEIATSIHDKVTTAGGRLFLAPKEIIPGDDFGAKIRNALVHSKELWLLLSPSSRTSEWVITEWGAAWALEKKIVPILFRLDHSQLPERLRGIQTVDLHAIDTLIAKVFPGGGKNK